MVKINLKKQKGITLVALVITIIVLLILAGITLNIVLNSGIISKSQTATSKYNEQATKEKLTLSLTEYKFKQLAGDSQSLESIIQNIGGEVTATTETEWTIELDGFIFTVNKKSQQITNIEPSNAEPLTAPEITATVTYSNDKTTATIEVTVTAKNGGAITSVKLGDQNMTQSGVKYTADVTTRGTKTITATETVGTRTKTATTTVNTDEIVVPKYAVTLTQGSGITSVTGGGEVEQGQSISISATVEDGKVFAGWNVTSGNASDVASLTSNPTTVTPTGNITISCTGAVAMAVPTESTGYVGCYADFDGNPGIDGIIYADLLVGKPISDSWGIITDNGTYTIPPANYGLTAQNVKSYIVSSTPVVDSRFDTLARYVVSPASNNTSEKKDRFYVMGLNDITGIEGTTTLTTLYWYKSAYGNMTASDTSVDFGAGKTNTVTILAKWAAGSGTGGYGAQDNSDMWKWIKVGTGETNEGWFVPSRGEWAAFGKAFNISSSNYDSFGLSSYYWSSSQFNENRAWYAYFINDSFMGYNDVNSSRYVRLSATF